MESVTKPVLEYKESTLRILLSSLRNYCPQLADYVNHAIDVDSFACNVKLSDGQKIIVTQDEYFEFEKGVRLDEEMARKILIRSQIPPDNVEYKRPSPSMPGSSGSAEGAIAAMVLGIIGIFTSWLPFVSIILGILAIVFYSKAIRTIRANPTLTGKGPAVAGLVMGIVSIVSGAGTTIFWLVLGAGMFAVLSLL